MQRFPKFLPLLLLLLIALIAGSNGSGAKTGTAKSRAVLEDVTDWKAFKKLLRTKNNVLILFVSGVSAAASELKVFREAAEKVRGTGTMLLIDCATTDRKKLCKKLKITPEPYVLKHYKNGDFHKEYSRQMTVTSMSNFMRDPAGDLPWDEDASAADVLHFADYAAFQRHLRKDMRPMLLMFYVPWCGFCKRLKPDYAKAASELKALGGRHVVAAMDVERSECAAARRAFNLTGFPTILYFERGQLKRAYNGENNKAGIVAFMQHPNAAPLIKPKEQEWAADVNSEVMHLTSETFKPVLIEEPSALVMFYAPWCGHCQRMKPEYEKAAKIMRTRKISGVLAAVDATKQTAVAARYKVTGYPTLKYYVNGVFKYDVNVRDLEKIVSFMLDPKEPPPPPPPEKPWEQEEDTAVVFLNDDNFNTVLKRKKHALVMFYAPWCGHCKSAKPEFSAAAAALSDDARITFAAVDCTQQKQICGTHEVRGYPTFKYFSNLKTQLAYEGGRTRQDFTEYMSKRASAKKKSIDEHMEL